MDKRFLTWLSFTLTLLPALALAQPYDVAARPISVLRPGTLVDNGPPEGWTHLIVKSFPKVASGDVDKIPERDSQLASLMFTALAARTQQTADGSWQLTEIATGAGTSVRGRDMIISSDTQQQLGADLGFFARMVLKEFDAKQTQVQYKTISRHFFVVDTIGAFRWKNENRLLPLRYALVLQPQTGQLDTFCWLMDADATGVSTAAVGSIHWLPKSLVFAPQLHVDYSKYNFLGIPSDTAFCSTNIPPGQVTMNIPADATRVLARPTLSAAEAQSLHGWFNQISTSMRPNYDRAAASDSGTTQR
ncbi:hypothetical protein EC9_28340 [Rosistilla ulvae]|uniref:GLPGLI family protein n=1 Tax=Rosistilla ulvae TaxID=1930277 RepID=A0A517M183_9BACT|nr:hypothetical protein [Rosistilla ulvae]QDS88643.1 hypothetical protein EC9_28340 [Rosistilla ulvae]